MVLDMLILKDKIVYAKTEDYYFRTSDGVLRPHFTGDNLKSIFQTCKKDNHEFKAPN